MGTMHVWLVESDGTVVRDYPVSGHKYRKLPGTGVFWVYSKSRYTGVANSPTRMEFMVRFAKGNTGTGIGFHSIPTKHGQAIESVSRARLAGVARLRPPVLRQRRVPVLLGPGGDAGQRRRHDRSGAGRQGQRLPQGTASDDRRWSGR